jgi:hypothetical protein
VPQIDEVDAIMINWEKCYLISSTINKINEYYYGHYPFRLVPEIQDYYKSAFPNSLSDVELRKISFAVEPKIQ